MLGKPPYERGAIAAVARRLAVDSGTLSIWLSRVERGQLDPATGYFDPEWVAQESARKKAAAARRARHSGDARQRVLPPFRSLAAIVADIETAEKMVEDAKKELAERLNLT